MTIWEKKHSARDKRKRKKYVKIRKKRKGKKTEERISKKKKKRSKKGSNNCTIEERNRMTKETEKKRTKKLWTLAWAISPTIFPDIFIRVFTLNWNDSILLRPERKLQGPPFFLPLFPPNQTHQLPIFSHIFSPIFSIYLVFYQTKQTLIFHQHYSTFN